VVLPAAVADDRPMSAPGGAAMPRAARRGRILVVDDEPLVGRALQRMLAVDHEVEVRERPAEALELIRAGARFDLILSDMMMPGLPGLEFLAEVERVAPEQGRVTIFLTGGATSAQVQDYLDAHPERWIEKPVGREELRAKVNRRILRAR
jgi:CheY-like chemotaxis protein